MADPNQDPGLINTAPGMTNQIPGAPAPGTSGPGTPVTSYNPAAATAATAQTSGYDPNAYQVPAKATVASQLSDILASGSPLLTQAETNARNLMNERGLINSSQAITAGQSAVISAALPIAQQDATTYGNAATNTTNAQNTALAAEAAAKNTAGLQDASAQTSTNQFNAGQTNAANAAAAGASNTSTLQAQQNAANLENIKANQGANIQIADIEAANRTLLQSSGAAANLYSQALSNLSSIITNPNLSEAQKAQALNDQMAQLNDGLKVLSGIANTPDVQSLLTFGTAADAAATGTGAGGTTTNPDGSTTVTVPAGNTDGTGTTTPPAGVNTSSPGYQAAMAAAPRSGSGNTAIQDIAQAIKAGKAITDDQWAQAGFGPNGAAPTAAQQAQANTSSQLSRFFR